MNNHIDNRTETADMITELAAHVEQIQRLQRQLEKETVRKESAFEQTRMLEEKNRELQQRVFAWFNQDECWIFQDDGHDYPESLVCPVVMSAEKLREFIRIRNERDELAVQVERLRNAAYGMLVNRTGMAEWYDLEKAYHETPPTALVKLKAQWQADI